MAAKRILIVDDDPDIVEYLGTLLGDHGYIVSSANYASKALAAMEEFEPDAVLIDVLLPGRSGLDLLVNLRRQGRWADVPLVVVTGNDQILQDDCQSYISSHDGVRGPDGVLGKPVDRDALLAILDALCPVA
ncbi:MAG: response regulator [bacterium]|nr:response regulator [bacterium]